MRHAVDYAVRLAEGRGARVRLGDFLSPELIMLDVKARSKKDLFARMVDRGYRRKRIRDKAAFLVDLWLREDSASTGLQHGVAVPHARSGASDRPVMLLARLAEPIPYETLDGQPVSLVFLIASPDDDEQYLRALSLLARTLATPGMLDRLRTARAAHDVFDILAHQFDQEQDPHPSNAGSR
jgi:PTS system fructose-specific IIC component